MFIQRFVQRNESNYLLIMKSFIVASQKKLRQWSHMRADNENCGFMRTYIPFYIGSEEKISSQKIIQKYGWIKETLSYFFKDVFYHFVYLYFSIIVRQVLPHIIKEVDISEELYSQQLIYHWQNNPEPRELRSYNRKLILCTPQK